MPEPETGSWEDADDDDLVCSYPIAPLVYEPRGPERISIDIDEFVDGSPERARDLGAFAERINAQLATRVIAAVVDLRLNGERLEKPDEPTAQAIPAATFLPRIDPDRAD